MFLKLPLGHPIKAVYKNGQVDSVYALTFPGEYVNDVTDWLASLFPSGVNKSIKAIYAVLSSSEEDWTKEAWRTHLLLQMSEVLSVAWIDLPLLLLMA